MVCCCCSGADRQADRPDHPSESGHQLQPMQRDQVGGVDQGVHPSVPGAAEARACAEAVSAAAGAQRDLHRRHLLLLAHLYDYQLPAAPSKTEHGLR